MGASKSKNVTYRCPVCGQTMAVDGKNKETSATKDHVFPKSQSDLVYMQYLCLRCNQLKASLVPTALLYNILRAVRHTEHSAKSLKCKSIIGSGCIGDILVISYNYGITLTVSECGSVVTCSCPDGTESSLQCMLSIAKIFKKDLGVDVKFQVGISEVS